MSRAPESIGKYRIIELLAEGGMGAVYKGVHPTLDRFIILKKLTLKGKPLNLYQYFKPHKPILIGKLPILKCRQLPTWLFTKCLFATL